MMQLTVGLIRSADRYSLIFF